MNDILKQRLVGALVLIALGVVFWPVLFIETDRAEMDRSSQIAPMPKLDGAAVPAPRELSSVQPVAQTDRLRSESAAAGDRQPVDVDGSERAILQNAPESQNAVAEQKTSPASDRDSGSSAAELELAADAKTNKTPAAEQTTRLTKTGEASSAARTQSTDSGKKSAAVAKAPVQQPAPQKAPAGPALDEQGIPIAWVLQVASLSSREKADSLTASLIDAGHKAYHRAVKRDGGLLYRVFVGPVFEREKLDAVKRQVDADFRVKTIIVRYLP